MTKWERLNQPKKVKPPRYYSVELGRHQRKRKIKKVRINHVLGAVSHSLQVTLLNTV